MQPNPVAAQRILVVDDEDAILFSLKSYFESYGYVVDCAREMEEAQAMLTQIRYDVVIADMRLTGSHGAQGLEIIGQVKEQCPWTSTILLSAHWTAEIEKEARSRGVVAFLQKPMPLAELAQIVFGILGRAS